MEDTSNFIISITVKNNQDFNGKMLLWKTVNWLTESFLTKYGKYTLRNAGLFQPKFDMDKPKLCN